MQQTRVNWLPIQFVLPVRLLIAVSILSVIFSTLTLSTTAHAAQTTPYKINFQGRLVDGSGVPMPTGLYNMKLRFMNASSGGSNLWQADRVYTGSGTGDHRVQVTNGVFSIQLGDTAAAVGDPALKRSFKGHKDSITGICFNPNLKQVVSSSLDGTLMVWNFKPTLRPYRFIGHKGPVYDVCISPNGQVIASCSADETVRIWNNSVEGHSQVIKSHSAPVKSVALSTDGSLVLSGSDDKTMKVYSVADRKF